jgi:hypothetical protein
MCLGRTSCLCLYGVLRKVGILGAGKPFCFVFNKFWGYTCKFGICRQPVSTDRTAAIPSLRPGRALATLGRRLEASVTARLGRQKAFYICFQCVLGLFLQIWYLSATYLGQPYRGHPFASLRAGSGDARAPAGSRRYDPQRPFD